MKDLGLTYDIFKDDENRDVRNTLDRRLRDKLTVLSGSFDKVIWKVVF